MKHVFPSFGKALRAQLRPRMLALTMLPSVLAMIALGALMWWSLQPIIDFLHGWFVGHHLFNQAAPWLALAGLLVLKALIVPVLAMWLLLPLMIVIATLFIGLFAMPVLNRYVSRRDFSSLETRAGGSWSEGVGHALLSFLMFAVLWMLSWPLVLFPPAGLFVHALLWGWLTYRVMAYDALARHADADERIRILQKHRLPLLLIGSAVAVLGAAPGVLWLGGAVLFFPWFAAISIWLYVLLFVFSGLWFQYYCLAVLTEMRTERTDKE